MYLWAQGIVNDDGVVMVRRARGLSNNKGGVGRGRGIHDVSEGSETSIEAAGDKQKSRGIFNDNGGIRGGR